MLKNNNINDIEQEIVTLKKKYESIKKLSQVLNLNLLITELDGKKVSIPVNKIINQVNNILKSINYPIEIYSIDELDDLLLDLDKKQKGISSKIIEYNNDNESIMYLSQEIQILKSKIKNIDYYSGLYRLKKILMMHYDPVKKDLIIDDVIITNREIIEQLDYILENLKYRINGDEYQFLQNKVSEFILEDSTMQKNEQLSKVINDLKTVISKIEEKRIQSELAIKLKAIEYKQRSIVLGFKKLDLNTISRLFTDDRLKRSLENFYKEKQLGNKESLTLTEIIDLLDKSLENKDEFIDINNIKIDSLQKDLSSKIIEIRTLEEKNKGINIQKLILKNAQLIKSIEYVSKCSKIKNDNYNSLNKMKKQSDQIVAKLTNYQANMLENIIDEVQLKIEELDAYIYNPEQMKSFLLVQANGLEKRYDQLTEKEKNEQFSKYYLYQSNSIYIEAIKAFCKFKITIPLLIDEYNYRNIGEIKTSKMDKMKQFFNDLDDFFDAINSQSRKRTRSILKRNNDIPKNITTSRNIYSKKFSLLEDNGRIINVILNNLSSRFIDYNKKFENLKLSRQEVSKTLVEQLTTDVVLSSDDLGDYGRNFAKKIHAAQLLEKYINANDEAISEILGNNNENKHK